MSKQAIKILWVEDSIGDVLLIKEAFEQAGLSHYLNVVDDGAEAVSLLFRRGRYVKAQRPDLIILDLNLPKKTGREIIAEMETDPELLAIPLVVLTSSTHDQDVLAGHDPQKSLYMTKPASFAAIVDMAKKIQSFWETLATQKH